MTVTGLIGWMAMFPMRVIINTCVALKIHPNVLTFIGLIYLYSQLGRTDYVIVTALAMLFAIMTSYTRARAESLIPKCKVGFLERPERIVLFLIGAFTNRMAAVMWVILVLSVFTVADRVIYTYLQLRDREAAA